MQPTTNFPKDITPKPNNIIIITNEQEFQDMCAEVRTSQRSITPIGLDFGQDLNENYLRFSPTLTYNWDVEYIEVTIVDNTHDILYPVVYQVRNKKY